jgi:hypothetical protein
MAGRHLLLRLFDPHTRAGRGSPVAEDEQQRPLHTVRRSDHFSTCLLILDTHRTINHKVGGIAFSVLIIVNNMNGTGSHTKGNE